MKKDHRINVPVTAEQFEKLKALSERTRVPVAVWMRDGVDAVLKANAHLLQTEVE